MRETGCKDNGRGCAPPLLACCLGEEGVKTRGGGRLGGGRHHPIGTVRWKPRSNRAAALCTRPKLLWTDKPQYVWIEAPAEVKALLGRDGSGPRLGRGCCA